MHTADVFSEYIKRIDRICLAVHDQVGRVKVDSHIVKSDVLHYTKQCDRSLLTGLKQEILTVLLALSCKILQGCDNLRVFRIMRILRHVACMCHKICYPKLLCKIRALCQHLDALEAVCFRHESQRILSLVKVPETRAFPAAPYG